MGRSVSDSASVRSRVPTICESAIRSRSERSICETAFTEFANDPGPRPCRAGRIIGPQRLSMCRRPTGQPTSASLGCPPAHHRLKAPRVVRSDHFFSATVWNSRVPHTGLALRLTVLRCRQSIPFAPRSQGRSTMNATPPPGWYPDHTGSGQRYWHGQQWTGHTAPMGAELPRAAHPVTTTLGVTTDGSSKNWFLRHKALSGAAGVRPAPGHWGRHRRWDRYDPSPAAADTSAEASRRPEREDGPCCRGRA